MPPDPFPAVQPEAWRLAAGIAALLLGASLLGHLLKITLARAQPHPLIDNLNSRINAWWIIALLVGLSLLAGQGAVTLLFGLASAAALREFVAGEGDAKPPRALLLGSFLLVLPLQYALVWTGSFAPYGSLLPLCLLLLLPLRVLASGGWRTFVQRTQRLQVGLLVCVCGISYLPALLTLPVSGRDGAQAAYLLVFLLLVVQLGDVLQYLWGKLAGRHPIAPRLSPAKTVEGTLGGLLSACALGAWLAPITPFTTGEATAISLLLALLGFLGGLAMSAAKRRRGIKDWGTLLPGHGGMLDRLDSLCFSAPAFYYLLRFGWAS